jgi:hypothetical protein
MEDQEQAVLNWIKTFHAGECCSSSLAELSDGRIIADILNEMVPSYFDKGSLAKQENKALDAGKIRSLLRSLDGYFKTVLKKNVDASSVNVNKIGWYIESPPSLPNFSSRHLFIALL